MKTKLTLGTLCLGICWMLAQTGLAAPSLPITKPPVGPLSALTGPPQDPVATNGQWFIDLTSGEESYRTHEFHDNWHPEWAGVNAISGYVDSVTYAAGPGTPIIGFTILATIVNDTATLHQEWMMGDNSHGETNFFQGEAYVGPMVDTKLAAEFAITDPANLPAIWNPPYRNNPPYIEAENEDQAGWYCWSPEDPDQEHAPKGWYYVPTWDFGTIPVGQSMTRQLAFSIPGGGGLGSGDPRYAVIVDSAESHRDVLLNRTSSLKISTWIEDLATDTGAPYPHLEAIPPRRSSDASVFHNLEGEVPTLDFGDAPEGALAYPSTAVTGSFPTCVSVGPSGWIQHGLGWAHFGQSWDSEPDGNGGFCPTFTPSVYDQDECMNDGDAGLIIPDAFTIVGAPGSETVVPCAGAVTLMALGVPCQPVQWGINLDVMVVNNSPVTQYVNVLMDWNQDGFWIGSSTCPGGGVSPEHVLVNYPVPAMYSGPLSTLAPPGFQIGPQSGYVWTRFTISPVQVTLWDGSGTFEDGESEDYLLKISDQDFGDAMDNATIPGYPTLLINNGARHAIVPGIHLGAWEDREPNGQPTLNADGDDVNPPAGIDDEDGVTLPPMFIAGSIAQVQVVASTNGFLNAWIDWNSNGSWADPGEQVFTNQLLMAGVNPLPVPVPLPPALVAGGPHSRWRFTSYGAIGITYFGGESNGEVEDYEVRLEVLDFGDAPDPAYPTLLASDGARHRIPSSYFLGFNAPDADPDGLPLAHADGDDQFNVDDEDGVVPVGGLVQGSNSTLSVVVSATGFLNAWLDFNQDGDWGDPGEQIASDQLLASGANSVVFHVPASAHLGSVYGRFRFSSLTGLLPTGMASDGEVEDHVFTIYQTGPDTNAFRITNIVHVATNVMAIWWVGESGVTYQTQYATNLLSDSNVSWTAWGPWVMAAPYAQNDTNAVTTTRFYRVVAPYSPPPP